MTFTVSRYKPHVTPNTTQLGQKGSTSSVIWKHLKPKAAASSWALLEESF